MKKFSVMLDLTPEEKYQLKVMALRKDITIRELVKCAIMEYLNKKEDK